MDMDMDTEKETLSIYNKNYYDSNKAKILEKNNKKVMCSVCGCFVRNQFLKRHMKTDKCNKIKTKYKRELDEINTTIIDYKLKIVELERRQLAIKKLM